MNLGFTRSPAFDGTHGPEVAANPLDLEETDMKRIYRLIKRRLAYLAKDSDEREVLIADILLLIADILLALGAFVLGIGAIYEAFYL